MAVFRKICVAIWLSAGLLLCPSSAQVRTGVLIDLAGGRVGDTGGLRFSAFPANGSRATCICVSGASGLMPSLFSSGGGLFARWADRLEGFAPDEMIPVGFSVDQSVTAGRGTKLFWLISEARILLPAVRWEAAGNAVALVLELEEKALSELKVTWSAAPERPALSLADLGSRSGTPEDNGPVSLRPGGSLQLVFPYRGQEGQAVWCHFSPVQQGIEFRCASEAVLAERDGIVQIVDERIIWSLTNQRSDPIDTAALTVRGVGLGEVRGTFCSSDDVGPAGRLHQSTCGLTFEDLAGSEWKAGSSLQVGFSFGCITDSERTWVLELEKRISAPAVFVSWEEAASAEGVLSASVFVPENSPAVYVRRFVAETAVPFTLEELANKELAGGLSSLDWRELDAEPYALSPGQVLSVDLNLQGSEAFYLLRCETLMSGSEPVPHSVVISRYGRRIDVMGKQVSVADTVILGRPADLTRVTGADLYLPFYLRGVRELLYGGTAWAAGCDKDEKGEVESILLSLREEGRGGDLLEGAPDLLVRSDGTWPSAGKFYLWEVIDRIGVPIPTWTLLPGGALAQVGNPSSGARTLWVQREAAQGPPELQIEDLADAAKDLSWRLLDSRPVELAPGDFLEASWVKDSPATFFLRCTTWVENPSSSDPSGRILSAIARDAGGGEKRNYLIDFGTLRAFLAAEGAQRAVLLFMGVPGGAFRPLAFGPDGEAFQTGIAGGPLDTAFVWFESTGLTLPAEFSFELENKWTPEAAVLVAFRESRFTFPWFAPIASNGSLSFSLQLPASAPGGVSVEREAALSEEMQRFRILAAGATELDWEGVSGDPRELEPGGQLSVSVSPGQDTNAALLRCSVKEEGGEAIGTLVGQSLIEDRQGTEVPPVRNFKCIRDPCSVVTLSWEPAAVYDAIVVEANGDVIAVLPGGETDFSQEASDKETLYCVSGRIGSLISSPSCCLFKAHFCRSGAPFVRGDTNEDGEIDLGDAIAVLSYLFTFGTELRCLDAADTNNDGEIDIGDSILILSFLFSAGRSPAPPFPECGFDEPGEVTHLGCEAFEPCEGG